jgi:hypothetical protein
MAPFDFHLRTCLGLVERPDRRRSGGEDELVDHPLQPVKYSVIYIGLEIPVIMVRLVGTRGYHKNAARSEIELTTGRQLFHLQTPQIVERQNDVNKFTPESLT